MNKLRITGIFTIIVMLSLIFPVMAQDTHEPGSGAPIVFRGDTIFANLNPIMTDDAEDLLSNLFPEFVGIDPDTGYYAPSQAGALVTDWEISDDGSTYTFRLRHDMTWSDGVPITSADILYFWETINNESVHVNARFTAIRNIIESITSSDDYTVEMTLFNPDCDVLHTVADMAIVPSHYFMKLFPDPVQMNDSPKNMDEVTWVTAGRYTFGSYLPGEQVTLMANPTYPDAVIIPERIIIKNIPDVASAVEQFLAGDITAIEVSGRERESFSPYEDDYQSYTYSERITRFISFNTADPENPQPAFDENGIPIDQGLHPVFSDVRVRQALNYAINFEELNDLLFSGYGHQWATHSPPQNWAYSEDIEPYPFDIDKANALLQEAGWVDTDNDGMRECRGCLYATEIDSDFEGSPFAFQLATNAGGTSQEILGSILRNQWRTIGATVDFQVIDYNTLIDYFVSQTYDAIILFWGFGYPNDPDGIRVVFGAENDMPDNSYNAGSYYNPRLEDILETAISLTGCDQKTRAELYEEAYQILHDESPWIWIGTAETLVLVQQDVEGFDPRPKAYAPGLWNSETWYIAP